MFASQAESSWCYWCARLSLSPCRMQQEQQQQQHLSGYQSLDEKIDNHPGLPLLINMKAAICAPDVSAEQITIFTEQLLDFESSRDEKSQLDEVILRLLHGAKNTLETKLQKVLEFKAQLDPTELATSASPNQKQKKSISRHPVQAKKMLLDWLREHNDSKRLLQSEKAKLAKKTSLTENQVANFIINARRRYREKLQMIPWEILQWMMNDWWHTCIVCHEHSPAEAGQIKNYFICKLLDKLFQRYHKVAHNRRYSA